MSTNENLTEAKAREAKWNDLRRNQLSFTNNLILTFTIAIIGFIAKNLNEFSPKTLIRWGISILFLSILFALAMSLSRLYDYRYTAKVTRLKRRKIEENDPEKIKNLESDIEKYRKKYEDMGDYTYSFLWCQLICFLVGFMLIIGYFLCHS